MKIAVDIMGGDNAPEAIVDGLLSAYTDFQEIEQFILVGDPRCIDKELQQRGYSRNTPRLTVVPASQVVEMDESPSMAVRQKKDSSIAVTARQLKEGRADAMVTAGNTGAVVASSIVINKLLPDVDRPAIATILPGVKGPFIILDVGANVNCKPIHLAQYAILGEAYATAVLKLKNPTVGLLSIGTEESKGTELTKKSLKIIRKIPINFIGNIEGNNLFANAVDIVVCDGFVGNIVLKSSESLAKAMRTMLQNYLNKTLQRKIGAYLAKDAFRELYTHTDNDSYGGAPLLGINGVCIIAHGASSPQAIRNAIHVSTKMLKYRINDKINKKLASIHRDVLKAMPKE